MVSEVSVLVDEFYDQAHQFWSRVRTLMFNLHITKLDFSSFRSSLIASPDQLPVGLTDHLPGIRKLLLRQLM
jgi:hypothetical protein